MHASLIVNELTATTKYPSKKAQGLGPGRYRIMGRAEVNPYGCFTRTSQHGTFCPFALM